MLNFNEIIDISMPITADMPVYKGRPEKKPSLHVQSDFNSGHVYESKITMNLHTGTHIDAPLHMLPDEKTVETLKLDKLICSCKLIDLTEVRDKITAADLEAKNINEDDFILLKTRNSFENILEKDFIYLDADAAAYLVDKKIKGVGIDALGVERDQAGHETHIILFKAGILILEGLQLKNAEEDEYFLFAAPINIVGAEAAPVRAVLIK